MKKVFSLILLLVLSVAGMAAAESAQSILAKSAAKIKSTPSMRVIYTMSADGHIVKGSLVICGNCFSLASPQMSTWFDGKTQWTYTSQIGEVNMIEPTQDELQQVNPFAIISSFSTAYNAKLTATTNGVYTIALTAKKKGSDIKSATLKISSSTLLPTSIKLMLSNNQQISIAISQVTPGKKLPVSAFRFDPKKYPGIQVVDLR